ncbi:hypothetical protein NMY22_g625 [Coprinellus aureogranulatus]|nr:hypothetical protein NMY22_g625 [Coprinellus aureogranulatus]
MYPHPNHIPQPPHSAGLDYKGLRPRIDPTQVPSPIEAIESDRVAWQTKAFPTLPGTHAPLCTSDFIAVDQGNASPKFARVSTWNMPYNHKLASECQIPLSAVFQPFADLDPREEPVPVIETGPSGPLRCKKCRGYVNPWCLWVAGGNRWKCNLCEQETPVPSESFCNLDTNNLRLDYLQRPELHKGTYDFVVPEEYWAQHPPARLSMPYVSAESLPTGARPPVPMDYIFALDVSEQATRTGFLVDACNSLLQMLYGQSLEDGTTVEPYFPSTSRIGIITFDSSIHFHDLSSDLTPMLVVGDLDEVFTPMKEGLLVDPAERRTSVESLLQSLPNRFNGTVERCAALASAVRASLAALAGRGGHLIVFQSVIPTIGPGALPPAPSEDSMYGTGEEMKLHMPRDKIWLDIAEECVDDGVGVTLFLAPSAYIDVGSIGALASVTGGEIFFHPRYEPARDAAVLDSQIHRVVTRYQGFNSALRVRASNGLRVTKYHGNFYMRSATDIEFGILDADKTISIELEHSGTLDPRGNAHLQCAVLYTTVNGQRRVRVINLALNVVELAGSVFQFADMETTVAHYAREGEPHFTLWTTKQLICNTIPAMHNLTTQRIAIIRDDLTEKCSGLLLGYRQQCAAATRHTQLIIPEAFRALPAFILALQKSKPLKARQVSSDVRNYEIHKIKSMDLRSLIHHLYPRLMALHDLEDTIAIPQEVEQPDGTVVTTISYPSCTRASHTFMESGGLYMIDNEETIIFWLGAGVSPQLLQDLFGQDDFMSISPHTHYLPHLDTLLSQQVRNILNARYAHRRRIPKMYIARQNMDGTELEFSDMLVEDQNNGAMSYVDYLAIVHRQISAILTGGDSYARGSSSMRSPW